MVSLKFYGTRKRWLCLAKKLDACSTSQVLSMNDFSFEEKRGFRNLIRGLPPPTNMNLCIFPLYKRYGIYSSLTVNFQILTCVNLNEVLINRVVQYSYILTQIERIYFI